MKIDDDNYLARVNYEHLDFFYHLPAAVIPSVLWCVRKLGILRYIFISKIYNLIAMINYGVVTTWYAHEFKFNILLNKNMK